MKKSEVGIFEKLKELEGVRKQAIRHLLKQRRILNRKLAKLGHDGSAPARKKGHRVCGNCGGHSHNRRTCTKGGK